MHLGQMVSIHSMYLHGKKIFCEKPNLEIVQENMCTSSKIFAKPQCHHGSNPLCIFLYLFPSRTYTKDPSQKFSIKALN
jgi:hypothetical protein